MKELLAVIEARDRKPDVHFALATVIDVVGSSYRQAGARMLIGPEGRVVGSVSGGCLEQDVIDRAQDVITCGEACHVVYDTYPTDDAVFGSGLGCQGRIRIFVEPLTPGASWALAEAVKRVQVTRKSEVFATKIGPANCSSTELQALMAAARRNEVTPHCVSLRTIALGFVEFFVEKLDPPPALLVFGAGPDALPLVRIGRELGFYITVIDRRPGLAADFLLEADGFCCSHPKAIKDRLRVTHEDAVVIMNHHYETDRDALKVALAAKPGYVGLLGPRRRTDRILEDLAEQGTAFSDEELAPLHAPAGLDLGSGTPELIALSILAEMQATLTHRSAGKLRLRADPINAR